MTVSFRNGKSISFIRKIDEAVEILRLDGSFGKPFLKEVSTY
jgi:hypothetical protein